MKTQEEIQKMANQAAIELIEAIMDAGQTPEEAAAIARLRALLEVLGVME